MKYFFILIVFIVIPSISHGQNNDSSRVIDEALIKEVLNDFTDSWNKNDAKAFANIFSEDADFTNVAGKTASGRNAIEKHHEPGFKTKWKDSFQKITQSKIRFIKSDVAAVDAWWELTGIKNAERPGYATQKGSLKFYYDKK